MPVYLQGNLYSSIINENASFPVILQSPLKSFERGPNSLEYPNDALMQADSSGMISAGIRKALDEKALRAFERLHASSVSASQQQACFTSHEAAEVLKLLQAATRK